jgi:hypothetical protein
MILEDSANEPEESAANTTREDESGDVAERDAPTAVEANPGMETILHPDPVTGVQDNKNEE